ncbi:MAG: threonine aldolase family protein [archaeon]|nr:threonine aldolase family protein [archaeon]
MGDALEGRLGDDVIDGDGHIARLERRVAELCGKPAALFCASGTMTNQIALVCHLSRLDSVVCDVISHVFTAEAGGIAFHSQAQAMPVVVRPGQALTAEQVRETALPEGDVHHATTRVVSLENTLGGVVFPDENLAGIAELAKGSGLLLHLDGARLWNAAVRDSPEKPQEYMRLFSEPFSTVSLCLSKGIGCPIGSLLAGSKETIRKARHLRKAFGGGWRQAGVLAAAGHYALDNNWLRMAEDHLHASQLADGLKKLDLEITSPVHTNMVWVHDPRGMLADAARFLLSHGIAIAPSSSSDARLVTHLMLTADHIQLLLRLLSNYYK